MLPAHRSGGLQPLNQPPGVILSTEIWTRETPHPFRIVVHSCKRAPRGPDAKPPGFQRDGALGGLAQIKLFVTSPQPIASGRIVSQRDPSVFSAVSHATVFCVAGDAYGSWFTSPCYCLGIRLGDLVAQFASPSAGVGRSLDLPVMEVTASVAAGTHPVTLDLSLSSFKDPSVRIGDPDRSSWQAPFIIAREFHAS